MGRHEEALESYDRAIGTGCGEAEVHSSRATSPLVLGRHEEASRGMTAPWLSALTRPRRTATAGYAWP